MRYHCPQCENVLQRLIEVKNTIYLYCMTCSMDKNHHRFYFCKDIGKLLTEDEYKNKLIKKRGGE